MDKKVLPNNSRQSFRVTTKTYCKDCGSDETYVNEGNVLNLENFARMLAMQDTTSILVEKVPRKSEVTKRIHSIDKERQEKIVDG